MKFIQESSFLNISSLKNLRIYAISVIILLCLLCIFNHFLVNEELSESEERYELIFKMNKQIGESQTIMSNLFELSNVNNNLLSFPT